MLIKLSDKLPNNYEEVVFIYKFLDPKNIKIFHGYRVMSIESDFIVVSVHQFNNDPVSGELQVHTNNLIIPEEFWNEIYWVYIDDLYDLLFIDDEAVYVII